MSELQPVALLPRREPARRFDRRAVAASVLLHLVVVLFLIPFPWARPHEEPAPFPVVVEFVEENGSSGAAGGGSTAETPAPVQAEAASAPPALVPSPPKPRPKPVAHPRPAPPVTQPVQQTQRAPLPEDVAPVAPLPPLPQPPRQQTASNTQGVGGALGTSGGGLGTASNGGSGRGAQGSGAGSFGDGQGPGDDYLNRVRRWIAKYKKYPPEAMKRKQEGTVLIAFTLARDGTVLSVDIERSSGVPVIDQAVFDMMRRASPVPPVPPNYPGATLSIALPIRYSIAFLDKLF